MRLLLVISIAALAGCRNGRRLPTDVRLPAPPIIACGPDREAPVPVTVAKQPVVLKAEPAPAGEPAPPPPRLSLSELVTEANANLRDVFFGYDSFTLDTTATRDIEFNQSVLRPLLSDFPKLEVVIEGHCDERGSAEYNLGLGDFRAQRTLAFLRELGLPGANLRAVSYGREKPQCSESSEACWSRNRRAHLFVETPR